MYQVSIRFSSTEVITTLAG